MEACPLSDHGALLGTSPTPRNAANTLIGNREGSFGGGGPIIYGEKIGLDLPLDPGKVHGKFGDASYYRDRMYKEQITPPPPSPHPPLVAQIPCRPPS